MGLRPARPSGARFREALATTTGEWNLVLRTQVGRALGLQRRFDESAAELDAVRDRLTATDPAVTDLVRTYLALERGVCADRRATPTRPGHISCRRWRPRRGPGWTTSRPTRPTCSPSSVARRSRSRGLSAPWPSPKPHRSGAPATGSVRSSTTWAGPCMTPDGSCRPRCSSSGHCPRSGSAVTRSASGSPGGPSPVGCARSAATRRRSQIQTTLRADGPEDGFVEEELGELLLALGRGDEAGPYFARAHEMLREDPWLAESEPRDWHA